MRSYLRLQAALYSIEKTIAALLLLTLALIVLGGTFSRYVLKDPWYGTDRLATYVFMVLCFWGIQMASSYYEHIQIELISKWLQGRAKALLSAAASLVTSAFLGLLGWWSWQYTLFSKAQAEVDLVLELPLWWVYSFFVLAIAISFFRYLIGVFLWISVSMGRLEPSDFQKKSLV